MMRTLWIVVSTLALANLLALAAFVAWLGATNRIDRERVERIRAIFAPTLAQEKKEAQSVHDEAARRVVESAQQAKIGQPPVSSEARLERIREEDAAAVLQGQRVQREATDLINTLKQARDELDRDRAEFQKMVEAFNAQRQKIADEEGSAQFQKAVQLLQGLKPDQAKSLLKSLIDRGSTDQVVSYLNALPSRTAARIVAEFEPEDPALAATLLERLRTRGVELSSAAP